MERHPVIYHDETTGVSGEPIVGNLVTGPIIHVVTAIYPANGVGFPAYGVTDEMARLDEEMAIINANIAGGQDARFFVLSWGDSWNYMIDLLDTNGHLDKTYAIWWCSYYKEGLKIITSAEMDKTSEFYTDITDVTSELYDPRFTTHDRRREASDNTHLPDVEGFIRVHTVQYCITTVYI